MYNINLLARGIKFLKHFAEHVLWKLTKKNNTLLQLEILNLVVKVIIPWQNFSNFLKTNPVDFTHLNSFTFYFEIMSNLFGKNIVFSMSLLTQCLIHRIFYHLQIINLFMRIIYYELNSFRKWHCWNIPIIFKQPKMKLINLMLKGKIFPMQANFINNHYLLFYI